MNLESYGWNNMFQENYETHGIEEYVPARVLIEHRGHYRLITADGEIEGINAGKLYYELSKDELPAVGDWVLVAPVQGEAKGVIHHILPRKSQFIRKMAGNTMEGQVVAANFDYVLIVTALNQNFNTKRLERYLAVAWDSGAEPIVVLSKADLCDDVEAKIAEVEAVALGVLVYAISSIEGQGIDNIHQYCMEGKTAVVLGSSGVGKSTLINTLCHEEVLKVNAAREDDDRGRHTTTHRQLVSLDHGGMIIDTPGMREIGLWQDESTHSVEDVFSEINGLASKCRFADCTHNGEPDCAIVAAIETGDLSPERLESYHKLQKELAYMERKRNQRLRMEEKKRVKNLCKSHRGKK